MTRYHLATTPHVHLSAEQALFSCILRHGREVSFVSTRPGDSKAAWVLQLDRPKALCTAELA